MILDWNQSVGSSKELLHLIGLEDQLDGCPKARRGNFINLIFQPGDDSEVVSGATKRPKQIAVGV
jgi:hypothetical protein